MATTCPCGAQLPVPTGRSRPPKYCSSACRQRAYRRRQLPAEMTSRARWIRRDAAKRPLTIDGRLASVTDPTTWSTYSVAKASTVGTGLGFVLGDGVGCIDLDHCIDSRGIADWAQAVLDEHRRTAILVERSMSGTGIHIVLPLDEAPGRRIRDGRSIEIYSRDRYIAVTGDRL